MSNPWFRLYSEFAIDAKMQMMSEAFQRRYIMLLCLRCSNGDVTLQDDEVAFQLRISNEEWLDTKACFVDKGLIAIDGSVDIVIGSDRPLAHEWRVIRKRIFERDDYTCQYCGSRGVRLECDHIYPVALGGGNEDSNLATACLSCNRSKRSKTLEEWKGC